MNSNGGLQVNVRTALGALPVKGAKVSVNGAPGPITLMTNNAGEAEEIRLPAPSLENSLAPGMSTPYSSYDVTVEADGYYTLKTTSVPVFPGVISVQNVNLIPISGYNAEKIPENELNINQGQKYELEE